MATHSMEDQATFIRALCERTWMRNGEVAETAWLRLEPADVEQLEALASGLEMLAQYDDAVKHAVKQAMQAKRQEHSTRHRSQGRRS